MTDESAEMGPVISKEHLEKINSYRKRVIKGAQLRLDGRKLSIQGYENGYFIGPTLFDRKIKYDT